MRKSILFPFLLLFFTALVSGEDVKKAEKLVPLKKEVTERILKSPASVKSRLNTAFLKQPVVVYKYNEPADLIELIPLLKEINRIIPRRFSLAEHQFVLSTNQMTVYHQFMDNRTKSIPKNSFITLTYDDAFGEINANVEVPLFYSPIVGLSGMRLSDWGRYPLGNYTMRFRRSSLYGTEEKWYIRAQTRF